MTHYMKLNPEPFEKIASGRKTIELRLYDEKRKLVRPTDEIVFTHIRNPYRSISVIVDSVITAASFESLFKHISLVDCGYEEREISGSNHLDMNQYYTEDSQNKYGVCGIRFSLNSERALSEIQIPICEVQKHLIKMLAEKNVVSDAYEWYQWHCANIDIPDNLESLQEIICLYDDSVKTYVYELSLALEERMRESGYNDIESFLDRRFSVREFYPIANWWDDTRNKIIRFFCGEYRKNYRCDYYTIFD